MTRLDATRSQILAFRRCVGGLDERLPNGRRSLRRAAWAGLQDSMPRAALLSIHARVEATESDVLENQSLVQVWGPRYSAYVVARSDLAPFTLGRLPDSPKGRRRAHDFADRIAAFLGDRQMTGGEVGRALGVSTNGLRYAAPTGSVVIRWDGARQPTIASVPPPNIEPDEARDELARRFLHVFGPSTAESFGRWAGIRPPGARAAFDRLRSSLVAVETPIGEAWILASDEPAFRAEPSEPAPARLLPSGDAFYLLQGEDRALLVPDATRRDLLWTPRVWPGAVLASGEIVGTWRRAKTTVTIDLWESVNSAAREAIAEEAEGLPLPDEGPIRVLWDG